MDLEPSFGGSFLLLPGCEEVPQLAAGLLQATESCTEKSPTGARLPQEPVALKPPAWQFPALPEIAPFPPRPQTGAS